LTIRAQPVPDEVDGEVHTSAVSLRLPDARRDWTASLVGVMVFLAGVAALVWVFWQAYHLYTMPSAQLIQVGNKTLDLQELLRSTSAVLVRVILLVIMALAVRWSPARGPALFQRLHRRG